MTEFIVHYLSPPNCTSPKSFQITIEEQDKTDNSSVTADYRFESARLESYKGWANPWMKPEILAAAGFYYTGESDKVRCFECQVQLCKCQMKDSPAVSHQRFSERCKFFRKIPCGNVPIGSDPSRIPVSMTRGVDQNERPYGLKYMPYSGPDNEDFGIEIRRNLVRLKNRPMHSEYANYAARLASYDRWPKAMSQMKEELVNAGFFYTESSDKTICYYCGIGLMNWEPNDDPWEEHAKWFDHCPYLILTKGTDFVSSITGRTYIEESTPTAIYKLYESFEKADSECITSGSISSSQNSICSEEINFNNADTSAE